MHNLDIDISDLPDTAPAAVKSFVSIVREGYHTKRGTWKDWQKAVSVICNRSPAMYFILCVGVGSLMRVAFKDIPGTVLHIKGYSTTGKTVALQTLLSLRADPADMTWCFDGVPTLKWYTVAADNNFLCLDDIHVAIMPDNGVCRPIPASYFKQFEDGSAPHTTIVSTSELGIKQLAGHEYKAGVEIDVEHLALWPARDDLSPWWMDNYISELKLNYGHAVEKIADSMSQHYDAWVSYKEELESNINLKTNPSRRSIFILANLGKRWLSDYASLDVSDFSVYDTLLKRKA